MWILLLTSSLVSCLLFTQAVVAAEGPPPASLFTILDPVEPSDSNNWPGFRGYNAQGISKSKNLPVSWDTQKNVAWVQTIEGEGHSSPIVWGNRVFLTTSHRSSDEEAQVYLLSLDAKTGQIIWKTRVGLAKGPASHGNSHASSTPVTDGERVYVFSGFQSEVNNSALLCAYVFDSGHQAWCTELGDVRYTVWGPASSPILYNDKVIQLCDSHGEESYLAAYDKLTGKKIWKTERKGPETENSIEVWSSPVILRYRDSSGKIKDELVVNGGNGEARNRKVGYVSGYDPHSGDRLWMYQGTEACVCAAPLISKENNCIISVSGRTDGRMIGLLPGRSDSLKGRDRCLWCIENIPCYVATGLSAQNKIYIPAYTKGIVSIFDISLTSSELIAQSYQSLEWANTGLLRASLVMGDRKIYASSNSGSVMVFTGAEKPETLARNEMGEPIYATPAIAGEALYIRTTTRLFKMMNKP